MAQARAARPVPQGGRGERVPQFTGRAIALMVIMLLLVGSYTSVLHTWWSQRQEIQATKAEIAMRKAAISDLVDAKARWEDPAYVRQQARARFGWVLPGEVGYRVIHSDGSVEGAALDDTKTGTQDTWTDMLWRSVQLAGRDPAAKQSGTPSVLEGRR